MTTTLKTDNFSTWLLSVSAQMEEELNTLFIDDTAATQLVAAMRYATLGGGKRLRPAMVFAVAATRPAPPQAAAVAAACAVELIHCYSLIHDDLPCMDDDDLRRGKPSCHRAYDYATALLAGNCLHSLAFEVLATAKFPPLAVLRLAQAAGYAGMCGGQALDISNASSDAKDLTVMCRLKTGALFKCALQLGLLSRPPTNDDTTNDDTVTLMTFADHFGLLFQLANDIKDIDQDTRTNRKTYATAYPDSVRQQAATVYEQAIKTLNGRFPRLADITEAVWVQ